ncbi:MAG: hypothetical protein A2Y33_12675 [Spirochaetes bacterium GWF1_51_8]|nr:MAG: hypothetical protein A2Y33_12675 [Spirochaetes bacterium GWF1_51_8]
MNKFAILLSAAVLLSCSSGAEKPSGAPQKKEDVFMQNLPVIDITVRLYDDGFQSAGLNYKTPDGWTKTPVPMTKDGKWWTVRIDGVKELFFNFLLDGAKWWPSKAAAQSLRTTLSNVYIKNGVMYPFDPDSQKPHGYFSVLTLNLHTYQEKDPLVKLGHVIRLIGAAGIDFAALQECAQHSSSNKSAEWNKVVIRTGNMAKIAVDTLKKEYKADYDVFWDWAHYGWGVWEEGVAILSKKEYKLSNPSSFYISKQTQKNSIDSRMAVMGYFAMNGLGVLRFVSVHVSWGDVQSGQLANLNEWVMYSANAPGAYLICGDFNMNFDSPGYKQMTEEYSYTDAYRAANPGGKADPTTSGTRIDYQFLKGKTIVPVLAQRVFTGLPDAGHPYQQVSDHYGVLVWYKVESVK